MVIIQCRQGLKCDTVERSKTYCNSLFGSKIYLWQSVWSTCAQHPMAWHATVCLRRLVLEPLLLLISEKICKVDCIYSSGLAQTASCYVLYILIWIHYSSFGSSSYRTVLMWMQVSMPCIYSFEFIIPAVVARTMLMWIHRTSTFVCFVYTHLDSLFIIR